MSDYLYYCVKCNSLAADTYENDEVACNKCGAIMTPLHVNEEEWNSMSEVEMRELILRYRAPIPQIQKKRPAPLSQEYFDEEDDFEEYEVTPKERKVRNTRSSQHYHNKQRNKYKDTLYPIIHAPKIDRICAIIGFAMLVVALIVFGIIKIVRNNADDTSDAVASENLNTSDEVNAPSEELNSLDDIENWDDSMKLANAAIDNELNENITVSLSEGPIFYAIDSKSGEVSFKMYSLKTGEVFPIFNYYISLPGQRSINFDASSDYFREQMFSAQMDKFVMEWVPEERGMRHVGWIDRYGNITDVTNIVHPKTSDFSSTLPNDSDPFFASNGEFVFYDQYSYVYYYYDEQSNSVVNVLDDEDLRPDREKDSDGIVTGNPIYGLDGDNRPVISRTFYKIGEDYYDIRFGGVSCDYVQYDDGCVFLGIQNGRIAHYGAGVTGKIDPESGDSINVPYYSGFDGLDMIAEYITPESDYKIENLAYSNNEIVFTAKRGNERALFKMSYVNRVPGEPELVQTIDDSWGKMIFWKDEDIPVTIGFYSENNAIPNKDYQFIGNLTIEGTWQCVGNDAIGQVDNGTAVIFDGEHCNVYSPADVYAFYPDNDHYILLCTDIMGGDHEFLVYSLDKKHIDLIKGNKVIELEKVK